MSTVKDLNSNKILGKGAFGIVYEGVWSEKLVAIKRIRLSDISSNEREEEALQKLDHPNVIKLLHVESDPMFRYYYLELCNASLDKLFLKDGDPKKYLGPMPTRKDVLYQLAIGLEYIHKSGLIHRDIKHENVLIRVSPKNREVLMKWADFGLSKSVNERGTFTMSGVKGTTDWLAPELLKLLNDGDTQNELEAKQRGTIQTDVFAEGLVLGYYLMDGLHPFGPRFQIATNILENKPVNLSKIQPQYARHLIKKMLADQPEKRITSSDVVLELERIRIPVDQTKLFALLKAQTNPSEEEIKTLIDEGFDLNYVDENGLTPLFYLTQNKLNAAGDKSLLKLLSFLIENGIDVNYKNEYGSNAFHYLCQNYKKENLIDIIRLLIENRIDVNCKDNDGWNALHLLCRFHQNKNLIDIIRLLIEKGIDVNSKGKYLNNALHLLCGNYKNDNLIDIIRLLIENGMDMNEKDDNGRNAFHLLCTNDKNENTMEIIRYFIEHGFDINQKYENDKNALHLLAKYYKKRDIIDIVKVFIHSGINIHHKDVHNENALHEVVKSSMDQYWKSEMIRLLIRYGIQVYPESDSQSSKYEELFTEKEFEGKKCLDYLVEEEIRLGWHEDCKSCEEILSIQEISRSRLQHHQMFVNIYSVFNLILEDLENWKQSNQKSGEAELDVENPGQWFRNKAEQYDKGDRKKCFLVMAEISEQVKDGFDSSCFNCDNYEIYLRYMHRITEITNLKEQKEEMEWFYLLPFNFPRPHDPIDPSESEEVKTKRENKRKWEETLLNWAHKEKEAHHGEILKKCAEEDDSLPAKLQHLCHGQKK